MTQVDAPAADAPPSGPREQAPVNVLARHPRTLVATGVLTLLGAALSTVAAIHGDSGQDLARLLA